MEWASNLHGGTPWIEKYQVAASVSLTGIPHLSTASNAAGVAQATTTGAANMLGCNVDTAAYATAQNANGTSPEALVGFIINPDAVWEMLLSGGATAGTALAARTENTGSTSGLTVTTGDDWSSPTYDEGVIWGYDGANSGQVRKITSVSSTAATVTVAFANDVAIGDSFLYAPYWPTQSNTVQLTSDLRQANAAIAVGTGAAFRVLRVRAGSLAGEGKTNSKILALSDDHIFNVTT